MLFGKLRTYLAKVFTPNCDGVCSGEFLVLRGFNGYLPFLKYFLLSYDFIMLVNASTYGAKMPRANWDFIGNCKLFLPPYCEQQTIVVYLDEKTAKIDSIIKSIEQQISLLHEYRTRLISDVVTGKLDVREVVVPQFEAVEEVAEVDESVKDEEIESEE